MAVRVGYNSWYISLPFFSKQQHDQVTKFFRCLENVNDDGYFLNFYFGFNAGCHVQFRDSYDSE